MHQLLRAPCHTQKQFMSEVINKGIVETYIFHSIRFHRSLLNPIEINFTIKEMQFSLYLSKKQDSNPSLLHLYSDHYYLGNSFQLSSTLFQVQFNLIEQNINRT
jgi:hypothetical protein